MFINQYLIHQEDRLLVQGYNKISFCGFTIEHDPNLNLIISEFNKRSIVLFGYIIDPLNPKKSDSNILKELCEISISNEAFFSGLQRFSGRYVIFYKYEDQFIVLSDALGLRQIYYYTRNDTFVLSSSPELILKSFLIEPTIDPRISSLLENDEYKFHESPWLGDKWIDKRIQKVLPNHYLDIFKKNIHRTPFFIKSLSKTLTVEYASEILKGSLTAIKDRYEKVLIPLTSGWDSRLILGASAHLKSLIEYYIFINDSKQMNSPDAVISSRLAENLDINFKIIHPASLNSDFKKKFSDIFLYPRILPKTRHIQWHYYNNIDRNAININGSGGEILRRVYQYYEKKGGVDIDTLLRTRVYNDFFKSEIEEWYSKTIDFVDSYNLQILDLFYWEQRLGNWHALFDYEQDIAIEEFTPFNNKDLLLSILQLAPELRQKYNPWICIEIMKKLWPEVLSEPFNPILGLNPKRRMLVYLRRHPQLLEYAIMGKNILLKK